MIQILIRGIRCSLWTTGLWYSLKKQKNYDTDSKQNEYDTASKQQEKNRALDKQKYDTDSN